MTVVLPESSSRVPYNPLRRAHEHILLIIDANEVRAQNLACLLTLAGMRAIATVNTYQAFQRFLKERFTPKIILIGQQEEINTPLFVRFLQRLEIDLQHETPVLPLSYFNFEDGLLLTADVSIASSMHAISRPNSALLRNIWQYLPTAQIPLRMAEGTILMESLPAVGFQPRVARNKRSFSSHLHHQLKAARKVIPPEQWDDLLGDVGLGRYCKEENWPPLVDQFTIPPEAFSLLARAVMFSNPQQPLQQTYDWATQVEADTLQKAFLIFLMQQIPKVIGADRTMRTLLNALMGEADSRRGEKLTEWKRLQDGSFIFVFYSNIFAYSLMGAEQPQCTMWQATFDLILKLAKQEQRWHIREIECSAQTHTGHCAFMISPR